MALDDAAAADPAFGAKELDALRETVYHRDPEAMEVTGRLRELLAAYSRRVDLLAAIAAAESDPDTPEERLREATEAASAEPFDDPFGVIDVTLALLVADRPDDAADLVLRSADAGTVRPLSDAELEGLVQRLARGGRQRETRELLVALMTRLLQGPGVAGAVLDLHRATAASALPPARRRVLRAAVAATERYLSEAPDDDDARVVLAAGLVLVGRSADALEAADAVLGRRADAAAELVRVTALTRLGRYSDAITALSQIAPTDAPLGAQLDVWRSKLLSADDRPEEAVAVAVEGLKRGDGEDPALLLAEAEGLAKANEVDKALELIDRMLDRDPGAYRPLLARAEILDDAGRSEDALKAARELVQASPDDTEAHRLLARILFEKGDIDGGVAALDSAVALAPDDPELALHRAQRLLEQGLSFLALEDVDRAQALGARGPDAAALRARILAEMGRTEDALAWAVRAFRMAHGSEEVDEGAIVDTIESVSQQVLETESWELVMPVLDELGAANALTPDGRTLRAEALRLAQRIDEAIAEADAAMALGGDKLRLRGTKAAALVDSGASELALTELSAAFAEEPDYTFGRSVQMMALDELGRVTEALEILEAHFVPQPQGWEEWATMAQAQLLNDLGRFGEAADLLESALAATPDVGDWLATLGYADNRLGRPRGAVPLLAQSIESAGTGVFEWPVVELGDALAAIAGRCDDEATVQYRRVVEIATARPTPRGTAAAGWAHFRMNDVEESAKAYEEAFAGRDDPLILERLRRVATLTAFAPGELGPALDDVARRLEAVPDSARARALIEEGRYFAALVGADERWRAENAGREAVTERLAALANQFEGNQVRSR